MTDPLAPPLPGGERSDREAIRVRGQGPIESHLPPHPTPLPPGERERAQFAAASSPVTERLEKFCVRVTRPIAFIGVTGMLIAAGVTVLDVLMRWLAGTAITALNEITALIFAVAVAACMPAGLAGGVNLRIDLLARWLTGRVAAWLDVLGAALLLVFFFILAWRI